VVEADAKVAAVRVASFLFWMKSAALLGEPEIWLMMFEPLGEAVINMSCN
jgi:hypothetical protein